MIQHLMMLSSGNYEKIGDHYEKQKVDRYYSGYIVFIIALLHIPLLEGQNTPYILLSVIGVMVETIAIVAVYSLGIVKKYEEK